MPAGVAVVALDPLLDQAVQLIAHNGRVEVPHLGVTVTTANLSGDYRRTVDGLLAREPDAVIPVDELGPSGNSRARRPRLGPSG